MDYSISIGIDKYVNLCNTIYAESDAKEFNKIAKEILGVKDCTLLINEAATVGQIKSHVEETVHKMNEGDRLFFYFAGHGISFYSNPRLSCFDSMEDIQTHFQTWYDIYEIMSFAETLKINVVIFLDACESTISYKRGAAPKWNENQYVTVFSAANAEEEAIAEDEFGHGVWSHFLFSALRGEDGEAIMDKKITASSLQNCLRARVGEYYTRKYGKATQTPYMWGKMSEDIVIHEYLDVKKNEEVKVADIYFGIVDADNEYKRDKDAFVKNFYDLNGAVQKIEEQSNIQYIFGKKGTGKTYIGRYLEAIKPTEVKYVSFNKFSYKDFANLAKDGSGYEPYMSCWEFLLLAYLLDFVGKDQNDNDIQEILKELFGFKVTNQQILNRSFKRGRVVQNERIKSYFTKDSDVFSIDELVEAFKYTLEERNLRNHYIIVDGLDEKMNDHNKYKEIINALIWSINELNDYFFDNDVACKIILLLRKDVFEFVSGANTNKIANGSAAVLNWINESEDKESYPLYEFINKRIKNSTSKNIELKDILPEYVNSKSGTKYKTWNWILNFTTYKPRDVVSFLSFCSVHCHNDESIMSESVLWNAIKDYSEYFYNELKDELYGFFKNEQIAHIFDVALPKFGMRWVPYLEAVSYINQNNVFNEMDNKEILNKLYEVGVLGIKINTGYEHWSYRSKATSLSELMESSHFKVHQGLWKKMSIW